MRSFRSLALWFGGVLFCSVPASGEWRHWGKDSAGRRYSELSQITRNNVVKLRQAWIYRTGEVVPGDMATEQRRIRAFEATPLMIDGVLYLSTQSSRVIALDPDTGKELWRFNPLANHNSERRYQVHRGVSYWESPDHKDRRILFGTLDARLICLDAKSGKPCTGFGDNGAVRLRDDDRYIRSSYTITSPPAIHENLVITGSQVPEGPGLGPSGDVRAFDVRTGQLVWRFHTVPRPGEFGNETWEGDSWRDRTGVNVWSIMSVDEERGTVFLPVGSPAYDFYGGDRKGRNLFGNSLVALDARTGKRRWHFQMVHHDIWDYDLPAQPVLVTVEREGRRIDAVAQVTKMGFIYLLDRETGNPLFPVEERKVPPSDVPGEVTWPTQPFPLKPPAVSRQTISRDGLSDVTPAAKKYCEELFDSLTYKGMFTPWGKERMSLMLPGTLGGGTWSGGSFDGSLGYLFVNANELGAVGMMVEQPAGSAVRYRRYSPWGEYARFGDESGRSCQRPPWGTLNAVDLNRGEIAWKVTLGTVRELEPSYGKPTGAPNLGGSIVTAGGLVFIGATTDQRFRAFDSRTGKLLWEAALEASAHATPMTYMGKNGKQYVVVAAGGGGYFPGPVSDGLVAFALP